ncbi:MAG TPA: prepilin-type N-terminal cleavage/methylation domain-containing protein [Actinokineospora sp.]|jgi:prepilin-type N-terminal cleavage/methylation domain-containing protein|nr:prepilin-type N-terminal cleavage/methylation domain-containing protein [Actinokineospora sp.]
MRVNRDEAGFTLVELLMAIVILSVITIPLTSLIISGMRNTTTSSSRMELSHDAQISSTYFGHDVATVGIRDYAAAQGAGGVGFKASIQLDAAYNAGGYTCGTATTPVARLRLLSDRWDNTGASPTMSVDVVAYYLAGTELHRIKCAGSVTDIVVAHYVTPGSLAVNCGGACDTAAVPQQVTLSFTVTKPNATTYSISLNGQRRQT